jgi:hypothetical protein
MPTFSQPNTAKMAAQQRDNMLRFAGETATLWAYISASAGASVAGYGDTVHSAGRTITAHFDVARGFLPNVAQHMTPGGMIPAGEFLMQSEYKPGVNDIIEHRGVKYKVEGEAWHEPLTNSWVATVKRAGT